MTSLTDKNTFSNPELDGSFEMFRGSTRAEFFRFGKRFIDSTLDNV